jgi:hypothetical protein
MVSINFFLQEKFKIVTASTGISFLATFFKQATGIPDFVTETGNYYILKNI